MSAATVAGRSIRPAAVRGAALAAIACVALVLGIFVVWPLVLASVFDGQIGMLAALLVAAIGSAAVYWVRGVLGGQQRFRPYSFTFYVEGAVRLVPLLALPTLGAHDPVLFAMGFACASVVAAAAVWPFVRLPATRATSPERGMIRSFMFLVGATALSQTIANLAPVVVTYRLREDPITSSVFGSTFVLARVPLFLFAPVLAILLPMLTRSSEEGSIDRFVRQLQKTVAGLLVVGGVGVALSAVVGPWGVEVLFGSLGRPPASEVVLLALATVLMMLALVLQPALVALHRQASVTAGWLLGGVVFVAVLVAPLPAVEGALAAQLIGPLTVVVFLGLDVVRTLATRRRDVTSAA